MGRLRSKAKAKAKANRGGLAAGLMLAVVPRSNCGSELARDRGLAANQNVWEWSDTLLIQADFSDEFWRLPGGKSSR